MWKARTKIGDLFEFLWISILLINFVYGDWYAQMEAAAYILL